MVSHLETWTLYFRTGYDADRFPLVEEVVVTAASREVARKKADRVLRQRGFDPDRLYLRIIQHSPIS
jgi:hypothetical protein